MRKEKYWLSSLIYQAGDLLGYSEDDSPIVTAIKQRWLLNSYLLMKWWCLLRYKDNKEGRMNSILFVFVKTETEEVSGHIDLTARFLQSKLSSRNYIYYNFRIQSENFLPYLTGSKLLMPNSRDLTFFRNHSFDWRRSTKLRAHKFCLLLGKGSFIIINSRL